MPTYTRGKRKEEIERREFADGNSKPEKPLWVFAEVYALRSASSVGSERNESHEASHLLSDHHQLHRLSDEMKFSNLLPLPKIHRRERSRARSEIGPTEGQTEADPAVPRPMESTPDLRIATSTLTPTSSPSIPRDQESKSTQTVSSRRSI